MTRTRSAALGLGLALAALLGACTPQTAEPTPSPSLPAAFDIDEDFPDPDVIAVGDVYTAFATGGAGFTIRVATSPDLHDWTVERRDALPRLPEWASTGRTWAPDVSAAPGGGFVMYVTAWHTASDRQCIGVATSASLDEPFTPASDEPIVCPIDQGGAIDASTFTDSDGTRYLLWKTDGNCCGLDTWIEIAPLSADGLSLTGEPTRLIRQTEPWEGNLVEAPVLVLHDGRYALFYSANDYGGASYAIGVAYADALLGPYEKPAGPLLSTENSGGRFIGPGGADVVSTPDGDMLVFHSWDELTMYRGLHTRALEWGPDGVSVVLDR